LFFVHLLSQPLYVGQVGTSNVGEYNATTGAVINANFITGLELPRGLAVSGNNLFVTNWGAPYSTVGEYDATTGAAMNANFATGLNTPGGLAVSGNDLFVADYGNSTVIQYDTTTGAVINFYRLASPSGLAVTPTPIANAGPNQSVQAGTLVSLDGSASSDPSGLLPLTYSWSFVSQPAGSTATLSDPAIVNPIFTTSALGNYVIQLVVTNAHGISNLPDRSPIFNGASAPTTVTISTTDAAPVANAGPDQVITRIGTLVTLDGSASVDAAGFPITYQWTLMSKPAGSNATLSGPTTVNPTALPNDFRIRFHPRFHPVQYRFIDPAYDLPIGIGGTATLEIATPTDVAITIVDPIMLSTG
jgi:hypothetical protein